MTTLTRMLACVIVATGLMAGVATLEPEWATQVGCDVWNLPALQLQCEEAKQRHAALHEVQNKVSNRLFEKQDIVEALIANKTTLPEAVRRFGELNRRSPECEKFVEERYRGKGSKVLCLQILDWVTVRLRELPPSQAESVLARLEAEICQHLEWHGCLSHQRHP